MDLVEGNLATPVPAPADVLHIDTAFLNDIAHSAAPRPTTPDGDDVAGGSLDPVAPGEYDNELLDLHFICGDGRCNENIALSAIHQVFHSEHDRVIDDIQNTLNLNPDLLAAYQATSPTTFEYGERLFQAARFVTEMEYQHLVFEEFARKVQPAINPFPAVRTDPDRHQRGDHRRVRPCGLPLRPLDAQRRHPAHQRERSRNDIGLLDGFLNPASYYDGGPVGTLNSQQAAGSIIMGLSDQVGNELDEFVTETLRNNLLGLPLDLAAINITRARSEGIPSLNNVRKEIFAATNDGQLTPYANWIDFGLALKHPESLVNFVAAYGQHPTIVAQTTVAGKREAARLIVNPRDRRDPAVTTRSTSSAARATWANAGSVSQHRSRRRRPVGRRPRREHEPVRWPARHDVQLRLREPAHQPAERRPLLLPRPHAWHEPAYPARGQLVRRADDAQHHGALVEGRLVRHCRLQVPAR